MNPRGDTPQWQRRLKEKLGENPARFLDHDLIEHGARHTDHTLARMVTDRIDGIDRIGVVNAWIAVERKLAARDNRRPRQPVIDRLEQRREYLEEHGERPDLNTTGLDERPDRYLPANRSVPPKEVFIVTDDGERVSYDQRPTTASIGRSFSDSSSSAIATDGGESE